MSTPAKRARRSSQNAFKLPDIDCVVEEVLDKRIDDRGRVQYMLKWRGYDDPDESCWIYAENCHCTQLIADFEIKQCLSGDVSTRLTPKHAGSAAAVQTPGFKSPSVRKAATPRTPSDTTLKVTPTRKSSRLSKAPPHDFSPSATTPVSSSKGVRRRGRSSSVPRPLKSVSGTATSSARRGRALEMPDGDVFDEDELPSPARSSCAVSPPPSARRGRGRPPKRALDRASSEAPSPTRRSRASNKPAMTTDCDGDSDCVLATYRMPLPTRSSARAEPAPEWREERVAAVVGEEGEGAQPAGLFASLIHAVSRIFGFM